MSSNKKIPDKGLLKIIYTLDELLQKALKGLAVLCLGTVVIIVFLQIISRYIFGYSFRWVDEFARWTNIYAAMCGGVLCYRYRALTGFEAFIDKLGIKGKRFIRRLNDILIALFCVGGIVGEYKLLELVTRYHQSSPVTKMPMAVPYFVIGLTLVSLLIFSINMLIFSFAGVYDGNEYESDDQDIAINV